MVLGRQVGDRALTFGVSGMLRQSNLVMWDRETESWWQQGTYEAIVGEMAGTRLEVFPAPQISWEDFKTAYPEGKTLSRESFPRYAARGIYGRNPYEGYDSASSPFLFREKVDHRLQAMERVVAIKGKARTIAYPYSALAGKRVLYDKMDGQEFVILFRPETRSALDADEVRSGRPIGSAGVFVPQVQGRRLTLEPSPDGLFRDRETGSQWNVFGVALQGPLKGQRLPPLFHDSPFWFYWAALFPNTEVYKP